MHAVNDLSRLSQRALHLIDPCLEVVPRRGHRNLSPVRMLGRKLQHASKSTIKDGYEGYNYHIESGMFTPLSQIFHYSP